MAASLAAMSAFTPPGASALAAGRRTVKVRWPITRSPPVALRTSVARRRTRPVLLAGASK